jgi:electron transfer flavoprotein beta subunit
MVRVAVLLSVGRHPASGRARRAPLDARALEMALGMAHADISAIHAGDPAEPALRDYLGMGLAKLTVLSVPQGSDPVPALGAHLARHAPDVILCGSRAESGEDSGMLPYLIAQALGCAMVADLAAIRITDGRASLTQGLARGKRRLIETGLPVAAYAPAHAFLAECEISPWRPRPKRMRLASAGSAADRLKAMTETKSGEGAVMIHPPAEEAARAIYDYLVRKRIIEERP